MSALLGYRFSDDFRHDAIAGLSVAAVALPVSIAYAQLAGFDPVVGLYSSILPLVAYAIFGTSRQLMVNPDAAACVMIAAAIAPLADNRAELYLSLTTALTLLTGLFCIAASYFRLGALADFLSKPILVGFLNGVAISIFLGQIGKLLGFSVESSGIIPRLLEVLGKIPLIHGATLAVGLGSFALLFACVRWLPRLPAALVALVVAGAATAVLELDAQGVAVLGPVPAGLPQLRWPTVPLQDVAPLAADAAGLALVVFTSGTLTARSFAAKGSYRIDVDREFAAFGAANISSALSQGFVVTGADSRTAVGVAAGGRTQVTGLVTADLADGDNLKIECRVNGEVRQSSNTSDMVFNCKQLVSYISRYFTLKPGDIIFTGTPEGVIAGYPKDKQVWLKAGDKIVTSIEKLGDLTFTLT